jgi:hypothetical protein
MGRQAEARDFKRVGSLSNPRELAPHGDELDLLRLEVRTLVLVCYWANLLDAVFTASHLTNGATEWNLVMRFLWAIHPVVYATAKFVFFRIGMEFVERAFPSLSARRNALALTALAFTAINVWHLVSSTTCVASWYCPNGL